MAEIIILLPVIMRSCKTEHQFTAAVSFGTNAEIGNRRKQKGWSAPQLATGQRTAGIIKPGTRGIVVFKLPIGIQDVYKRQWLNIAHIHVSVNSKSAM